MFIRSTFKHAYGPFYPTIFSLHEIAISIATYEALPKANWVKAGHRQINLVLGNGRVWRSNSNR